MSADYWNDNKRLTEVYSRIQPKSGKEPTGYGSITTKNDVIVPIYYGSDGQPYEVTTGRPINPKYLKGLNSSGESGFNYMPLSVENPRRPVAALAEEPSEPLTPTPPVEVEVTEEADTTTRTTADDIEQTGRELGKISLDDAKGLAGPNTLADLANYFGSGGSSENIIGTIVNGTRYTNLDEDALIDAQEAWQESNPNERRSNFIYDNLDQERTVPMSRAAGRAFLDAPSGSPMAQIRARNAALGIVEGAGGTKYAQVNGQMVELNDAQYRSIVDRDSNAISGILTDLDPAYMMPGGNMPPQTSTPVASTVQQPQFDQELLPEFASGISEKARQVMMQKAGQILPKVYAANTPSMQEMNWGAIEDFYRSNQMPVNNLEVDEDITYGQTM